MKKITFLLLAIGFSSFCTAQCLDAPTGQWPFGTYTPTCNGTADVIDPDCYAGDYSLVEVTAGETYTFGSSVATDFITLSDEDGTSAITSGGGGSLTWVADITGIIRFYTHLDDGACGAEEESRERTVMCGTPPPPLDCVSMAIPIANCGEDVVASLSGFGSWDIDTCGFETPGMEAIYSFTPAETGVYSLKIISSSGGYVDYFYKEASGSCDANGWECIGDATGAETNQIGELTAGVEYYILADAEDEDQRDVTFQIKCPAAPPVNDEPAGAIQLTLDLGTACGPNQITDISNEGSSGSDGEVDPSCIDQYNPSPGNGDLWYYFTAQNAEVTISISDIDGDIISVSSALYSGTPGGLVEVGECSNAGVKTYGGLTPGSEYYLRVWDYGNDGIGTFSLCGYYLDCVNPTATYTVVPDCANGDQFLVDVNVTDMGSATSLTISDDQSSTPQVANAAGTYTFGPFANGINVVFNVQNDQNALCSVTSAPQTQGACPPDCATAEVIASCGDATTAAFSGAGAWNITTCGFQTAGAEKLFSFTPAETGLYSLAITASIGGYVDYFYKEASGSCDATGWECIGDANAPETNEIGILTAGTEYLILLDSENANAKDITFNIVCAPSCTNAVATYQVVSDCANGEQFNVNVTITNMGSATSLTISDDQGVDNLQVTATGTYTFGPFPNGTPVVITVANDADETCVLTSPTQNQTACPPANDSCGTATVIASFPFNDELNASAATNNAGFITTCTDSMNDGVWYTFAGDGGDITITATPTGWDPQMGIFSGTCGAMTCVGVSDVIGTGAAENYTITASAIGTNYYVNLGYWSGFTNGAEGAFTIDVITTALGIEDNDFGTLTAYPNPVKGILKLSSAKNISGVSVFNMLGQQMMAKTINANESQVDMSNLAAGTYFVKVSAENQVKTIKIIKQ